MITVPLPMGDWTLLWPTRVYPLPRPKPAHDRFYRAMLCIRGTTVLAVALCPSVRPSVRPSLRPAQVGVLLKRLNVGSHKQHHTIAQVL